MVDVFWTIFHNIKHRWGVGGDVTVRSPTSAVTFRTLSLTFQLKRNDKKTRGDTVLNITPSGTLHRLYT